MVPLFAALIFGLINTCIVLWASAALHYTVENASRCRAVDVVSSRAPCDNDGDTVTFATNHYVGPSIAPTFTAQGDSTCGYVVRGSATVNINAVVVNVPVALTAKSCFPSQTSNPPIA